GTPIRKNNIFSEKIPLEAFVLYEEPASFYQSGVWSEALRFLFQKTNINNDSQKEQSLEKITQYLHSQHGVRYDIVRGVSTFLAPTDDFNFLLMNYLKKKAMYEIESDNLPDTYGRTEIKKKQIYVLKDYNIVNCFDQACAVIVLSGALGIKTELLSIFPFGYMKLTKLVGIDKSFDFIPPAFESDNCDNPFFGRKIYSPLRIVNGKSDNNGLKRSAFYRHAVCAFLSNNKTSSDYRNNQNQYKKDILIYDACAGPKLGLNFNEFIKKGAEYKASSPPDIEEIYNVDGVF
ncbi:hypothetical protein DKK76_11420, partial [Frischella perrara]